MNGEEADVRRLLDSRDLHYWNDDQEIKEGISPPSLRGVDFCLYHRLHDLLYGHNQYEIESIGREDDVEQGWDDEDVQGSESRNLGLLLWLSSLRICLFLPIQQLQEDPLTFIRWANLFDVYERSCNDRTHSTLSLFSLRIDQGEDVDQITAVSLSECLACV